jgi:alpha-glucosidase
VRIFHRSFFILLFLSFLLFVSATFSQSISVDGNTLLVPSGSDIIAFRVCTEKILMINYRPAGVEDPDTLVVSTTQWTPSSYSIDTTTNPMIIRTAGYHAEITKSPVRFSVYKADGLMAASEASTGGWAANSLTLTITPSNFYGVHNTQTGTLTSNSGGSIYAGSQGGAGGPFIWTTNGWGLLADADGGNFNLFGNQFIFTRAAPSPKRDIEVYFMFGTPKEIINGMTDISGKPPLMPKFTMGFMNTEWGIDQTELLSDVQTYRQKGIPLDAYILDFDWMAWGEDNYGEFRFGPKFPSAPGGGLRSQLDLQGVKLFGIRKPRIHIGTVQGNYCVQNNLFLGYEQDYFSHKQVGLLNFHIPLARSWYWQSFINQDSYNNGIIGYWNDEADQYDGNFMFLQMQRAMYEGQRAYNNKRVWSINRNFYTGSQRYAYGHWSGDISTGFSSMANQRLFMLSSITLGSSWWGMDIGGFNGTPDAENYFRWIQFGAFVPIFRVHGTYNQEREPWNYGAEAEAIATKYIKLRYRLLPYIYSYAWENHRTGVSIVHPLVMEYPTDPSAATISSEWMFGSNILVSPIVAAGATTTDLYLPEGRWINFQSGRVTPGPGNITVPVTREDIPLYVKAGSVIPMAPVGAYVDDSIATRMLILSCYPGGAGSFTLYEDDGSTYDYEKGIYCTTQIDHLSSPSRTTLSIGPRTGTYTPPTRDVLAEFQSIRTKPDSVTVDGISLTYRRGDSLRNMPITGWAFDDNTRQCLVRFPDNGSARSITVVSAVDNQPPKIDTAYVTSDTTIVIIFNETVLYGADGASAENIGNYDSKSLTFSRAVLSYSERIVTLTTSKMAPNTTYKIVISGIADSSPLVNVIVTTEITVKNTFVSAPDYGSDQQLPKQFGLSQNYPNPFNPSTTLILQIPNRAFVSVKVFSLLGQHVLTLADTTFDAGEHKLTMDGSHLPSGVYVCRMEAQTGKGTYVRVIKLVLQK